MGEKYKVEHDSVKGWWFIAFPDGGQMKFADRLSAEVACQGANAGFATAQAELKELRAKWEALRGEAEDWREIAKVYDLMEMMPDDTMAYSWQLRLREARTLTDSTHALEDGQ